MRAPLIIESTEGCMRTQFVLFAAEEIQAPYELRRLPSGYFEREHSATGPWIRHGAHCYRELNLALRAIAQLGDWWPVNLDEALAVETWLEHQATWLRPAGVTWFRSQQRHTPDPDATHILQRSLKALDNTLRESAFLCGAFSVADCAAPFLLALRDSGPLLTPYRHLHDYLTRVEARPAWLRARQRWLELRPHPLPSLAPPEPSNQENR